MSHRAAAITLLLLLGCAADDEEPYQCPALRDVATGAYDGAPITEISFVCAGDVPYEIRFLCSPSLAREPSFIRRLDSACNGDPSTAVVQILSDSDDVRSVTFAIEVGPDGAPSAARGAYELPDSAAGYFDAASILIEGPITPGSDECTRGQLHLEAGGGAVDVVFATHQCF